MFELTLLRLPYAPGKFEMSWHCREDDDDGGGPPTKVPRESIDDNPTRRHTRSSLPALDLEKCLLCDSKRKTTQKAAEAMRHLPAVGVFPNNSAQRCSNINENFSEKTTCALGHGDRPADRPSCEGSDVPCLFLQKVHQPQVPGLRCHHSTTEPNDSNQTWLSNVLP